MRRTSSVLAGLALACASAVPPTSAPLSGGGDDAAAFERAGAASPRITGADVAELETMAARIDGHFAAHGTHRLHVQLDRPLYRPGESVWIKTWTVRTADFGPHPGAALTYELVNPRGQVVQTKAVPQQGGTATNDFVLPADAPGGQWTLRASHPTGEVDERPFVVASYEAPRIQKELEFVREAYGAGDTVEALVELRTGTGEPLGDHPVRVLMQVDGQVVAQSTLRTTRDGAVLATGTLPDVLQSGDGLLTVLVEQGGVTESISRSIPIVLADARLAFFPEGGDLVAGLPGRVYLESTNRHGEPADVEGYVTDDQGERVATFRTVHDGLGRFAFTPRSGRRYQAHVTVPAGVATAFEVPLAQDAGCVLRSFDDLKSEDPRVRVAVRCTDNRTVYVTGVLREATLDTAAVRVREGQEARVYLAPSPERADQPGAVRVTAFDTDLQPLAERLVYRNHGRTLQIGLTTDQSTYGPRDEVIVDVTTRDPSGDPVAAELALAVVDDKVLTFADDENGHILTRLYLEPELVDSPEDPGFYFDPEEPLAARAMDLVMGTKGYRRFDWRPVFSPPPVDVTVAVATSRRAGWKEKNIVEEARAPIDVGHDRPAAIDELDDAMPEAAERRAPPPMAAPAPPVVQARPVVGKLERFDAPMAGPEEEMAVDAGRLRENLVRGGQGGARQAVMADELKKQDIARAVVLAPVRVFPTPDYRAGFTGTRTDFRDTVYWAPTVQTGAKGTAQVRFYLSDAVTAFRLTAEGLGGGFAGHGEATINSVLPVSVSTRLPPAVSVGDRLLMPLTVTSTRHEALQVSVDAQFESTTLALAKPGDGRGRLTLPSAGTDTFFVPVEVGSGAETATIRLSAEGGGLSDVVVRQLEVVPPGFPQVWSAAGDDARQAQPFVLQLDGVVPDSLQASVTWHPSPVSSLISGMEGLIRTPGGCFEQTSSTNWPNVAILRYLDAHDGDPRLKMQSAQALDAGYGKLTGYQVEAGGFETWGSGPGKEALSAFGLLQFADMSRVYDVEPAVLTRDATYLLAQRDGQGGFARTGESAHGYGSAPKPVLDGFITYALVETGHHDQLRAELAHQAEAGRATSDPYVLALAARSLLKAGDPAGKVALKRLIDLQAHDGSFPGAESSITRSYEANLLVESTALAALAMLEGGHRPGADRAVDWLIEHRQGAGTWGATQATALALAALTEHAERSRVPASDGRVQVVVNGELMQRLDYRADETEPLVLDGWASALRPGRNVIELVQLQGAPLPFSVDVQWMSVTPVTAEGAELALQTSLAAKQVAMGDTVRLTATVANRLDRIVPSPIARIGLPAGLEAQTWQLQELQDRGQIAFFETRPREVTLYWDGIHPGATHEVPLDLVATVPGRFTAPASAAYPYYNDDEKAWAAGTQIEIAIQ